MKTTYTISEAEKNFSDITKDVNSEEKPVTIKSPEGTDYDVVIISKKHWDAMQETLHLAKNGVIDQIKEREKDGKFIDFDKAWNAE
ncbi:type II toxin-antitoxin system Phd/YefM family antitoxin [Companilactobacillus sp.]|jgi:prevent-host-death family protein|uniref:type II toxin-antitoxin system Phd/YefM family antitoxin n=1 Tax=Companilactobacillus sp. TaxID=2767905 RepID=UPI0025BF59FD|nr:type II toxin-antitoxin system prevent-host-death family antitoxin [Companilactobacillus sp.]MCH4009975.1 type II toxin-antitoxin system Phd/YefM family antitoxin [Companilactobacillus sp.]MCH4052349.1 type II toxin-antitoxin system Phd/YefM family antitoxin [Companilactobacillus sp.]MCH4077917.1 type II toxin-antitoxin system Phd/YefM family antitoxin [Companilactobacillus sp.]MCH4126493.1 type II toxin-antitoxin system Phd/YefM family antitoxin [Companilactobacillus sp.]MCH4132079.1 type 